MKNVVLIVVGCVVLAGGVYYLLGPARLGVAHDKGPQRTEVRLNRISPRTPDTVRAAERSGRR